VWTAGAKRQPGGVDFAGEMRRGLPVKHQDTLACLLARARGYPYAFPQRSYVYRDAGAGPFDPVLTRGRTPVLAIGSNQSPERLVQKFGHDASHVIPVQRARLDEFDVVYSAHVASYGAIPAMLQVSPGARVSVAITWLDDDQLEVMHESEIAAANYGFAVLEDVRVHLDGGGVEEHAFAYVSSRGHLAHDGAPVSLAAIACENRRFPSLCTAEMLERVRERIAPELDADAFVHRLVADPDYRAGVTRRLAEDAVPFGHPARRLR
jgi:hypothetical protein